jgi:hypothetical protein
MGTQIEIGRRIGNLTVVEKLDVLSSTKQPRPLYKCLCDCGNYTIVSSGKLSPRNSGFTRSCGCARSAVGRHKRISTAREATARQVWRPYRDGCPFEKFMELSQLNCEYCGIAPYRKANWIDPDCSEEWKSQGDFIYNGLDRIDSSKDHSIDNIVPCCATCNTMKMALGRDEFLLHIKKIYDHSISDT